MSYPVWIVLLLAVFIGAAGCKKNARATIEEPVQTTEDIAPVYSDKKHSVVCYIQPDWERSMSCVQLK